MTMEDCFTDQSTPSSGQQPYQQSGKASSILVNDIFIPPVVRASKMTISDKDILASHGADDQDSTSTIAVKGGPVCSEEDILTQLTGSGGGGMKDEDAMPRAEVSIAAGSQGKCVHLRGGRCLTHGLGAKYVFKPRTITEEGPDGKKTRRVEKKWFWRCDVDVRGRKMKQSCISYFLKADTPGKAAGIGDTILLRGGAHSMNSVG